MPEPRTSNNKAAELFDRRDFTYTPKDDQYRCRAGERAIRRFTTLKHGLTLHRYWSSACPQRKLEAKCTLSPCRRITRCEYGEIVERVQRRLERAPEASKIRRQTAEHVFGTLKA